MEKPRLAVELIPFSMWGKNTRSVVSLATWETLRWYFGARHRPRFPEHDVQWPAKYRDKLVCAICRTEHNSLELHEEWEYDDTNLIQHLGELIPLCSRCHLAKHLGRANAIGQGDVALAHLAKVNGWSLQRARKYDATVSRRWLERLPFRYDLDFTLLKRYVPVSKIHLDWLDEPRGRFSSRLDSIVWAHDLLNSEALILDTETTGLPDENPNAEAIELAIINMRGKVVYDQLFRPLHPIPRKVVRIHGIRSRDVKNEPTFAKELKTIRKILTGKTIISYNARFDRTIFENTCFLHQREPLKCRWECAMQAFRTFSGSGQYLKLPGGSHRALADAKATLKLIAQMAKAEVAEPERLQQPMRIRVRTEQGRPLRQKKGSRI